MYRLTNKIFSSTLIAMVLTKIIIPLLSLIFAFNIVNAEKVRATVTSVKGKVEYNEPGSLFPKPLKSGDKLSSGSIIRTGPGSEVVVAITPGSAIRIDENTVIAINDMEYSEEGGKVTARKARIQLSAGTLSSLLDDKTPEVTDFRIETPQGTAAARGTFYGVSVVDGQTFVKVQEGKVGFVKNEEPEPEIN